MSVRLSEILVAVQETVAMPTLTPEDTGLPMAVCLLGRDGSPYGPKIGVSPKHGKRLTMNTMVSISISNDPKIVGGGWLPNPDLRLVRAWVLLNMDVLLRHWRHELPSTDMLAALRLLGEVRGRK
ncbi:MAG: DUF4160 domain-containing protein [Magnetospirillum gryphiswaldense]|nr:DUF4160 domain-containing protein [Magnetospirillum gryphiswaldense]